MKKDWQEATRKADLEQVRSLLENGADIESKQDETPAKLLIFSHSSRPPESI